MADLLSKLSWRRSSHCANNSCVEVAVFDNEVFIRDSREKSISVSKEAWSAFIKGAKSGEFDAGSTQAIPESVGLSAGKLS
jgi:hypothetical protein